MTAATEPTPPTAGVDTGRTEFKVIGLIGIAHFFSHFYIYLLPPLFPMLKDALGVSYTELGLMMTVFSGTTGLTQIPFGFLVDRFGARAILIGGLAVEGLAFLLIGFAGGYWTILALLVVAGAANGVYHPADYAILSGSVSGKRMGRAFSLHTFAGNAGFALAPPAIVLLSTLIGWQAGLALCGAAGIVMAGLLILYARHLRDVRRPRAAAEQSSGLQLLLSPPILLCLLFFTMLALGSSGLASFFIVAIGQLHDVPVAVATAALTAYLVASSIGVLIGGFIADRTVRHNLVAAICFLSTAVMIAAIGALSLPVIALILLMIVQGLMHGAIMPSRDMIVRSVTPAGAFGKVFGFVTSGFSIGGIAAPPIFGWILDQSQPEWVFFGIAGIMLCSMATVFTTGRRQPGQ